MPNLVSGFLDTHLRNTIVRFPDAIALDIPPSEGVSLRRLYTYQEFGESVDSIKAELGKWKVGRGNIVAVLLPRSDPSAFTAPIAVLERGGAWVSIDPSFPDGHIQRILADAEPVVVVTDSSGQDRCKSLGLQSSGILNVENTSPSESHAYDPNVGRGSENREHLGNGKQSGQSELDRRSLQDVAYLIYTSGTTGNPKGVMISHAGIENLIRSDLEYFSPGKGDRIAQGSSHSYDSSVEEIWMALACGATVVVMDDSVVRLGPDLVDWLRQERITVICPPPTLLRTMGCNNPQAELPEIRVVYVGGEALPRDVLDSWAPGRMFVNGYGPTECSVTTLRARLEAGDPIRVGYPVSGTKAWILDENLEILPDGESGELCIGGPGVALGYRNLPEISSVKFVEHPICGRIYRTGDLAQRLPDGSIDCLGRIDAQVKLRGYRIELEAVEAEIVRSSGVREAACRIQGNAGHEELVAWIVPEDENNPPDPPTLSRELANTLPFYMIPSRYGYMATLPRSVGGKILRNELPDNAAISGFTGLSKNSGEPDVSNLSDGSKISKTGKEKSLAPRNPLEEALLDSAVVVLDRPKDTISPEDDFFLALGGTSLLAARWVSLLRKQKATSSVTVRDIYEARTILEIAQRINQRIHPSLSESGLNDSLSQDSQNTRDSHMAHKTESSDTSIATEVNPISQSPFLVTLAQAIWISLEIILSVGILGWGLGSLLPWGMERIGSFGLLIASPFLLFLVSLFWVGIAVGRSVLLKKVLVGNYTTGRTPIWSYTGFCYWVVEHTVRQIPWRMMEGTLIVTWILRLLGAQVGRNVHFHRRSVPLSGGWDLLEIGDGVTLGQDAAVLVKDIESGHYITAPVRLDSGSVVGIRATVAGGSSLGSGSILAPLSALGRDEHTGVDEYWSGVPAKALDRRDTSAIHRLDAMQGIELSGWSENSWACARLLASLTMDYMKLIPVALGLLLVAYGRGMEPGEILEQIFGLQSGAGMLELVLVACMGVPALLVWEAVLARGLGNVENGEISLRSFAYLRVWLTTSLVDSAGLWLTGTLFWPIWLRFAGMKVGKNCEISTIIDLLPRKVSLGSRTFCADGIYLGCPEIRWGRVELGEVSISQDSFLGNHAIVGIGANLPPNILLGVSTIADTDRIKPGSSWFGIPAFELPRRQVIEADRSLTHDPGILRYTTRLFWELARFALPGLSMGIIAVWGGFTSSVWGEESSIVISIMWLIAYTVATAGVTLGAVVLLKWVLLGRVIPGVHPLWSCWCSRWDYLYFVWSLWVRPILVPLQGTLLLNHYLRLMGVSIGKRVALSERFTQVVDPDMIHIDDDATVSSILQAHTFEDRMLKVDHIRIEKGATLGYHTVPLYGARIGENTRVSANSVVMKEEHLLSGKFYSGVPTHSTGKS